MDTNLSLFQSMDFRYSIETRSEKSRKQKVIFKDSMQTLYKDSGAIFRVL